MEGRESRPSFRHGVEPNKERSRKNLILNGKYIVGEEIGKGASGLVRARVTLPHWLHHDTALAYAGQSAAVPAFML